MHNDIILRLTVLGQFYLKHEAPLFRLYFRKFLQNNLWVGWNQNLMFQKYWKNLKDKSSLFHKSNRRCQRCTVLMVFYVRVSNSLRQSTNLLKTPQFHGFIYFVSPGSARSSMFSHTFCVTKLYEQFLPIRFLFVFVMFLIV